MFSISSGQFAYSGLIVTLIRNWWGIGWYRGYEGLWCLTIPCFKHVVDEEVIESDLGFWDRTRWSIKLRHHYRQALKSWGSLQAKHWWNIPRQEFSHSHNSHSHLSLLIVSLGEILLSNPLRPNSTVLQRARRVWHIGTFDQHPKKTNLILNLLWRVLAPA